MLLRTYIIITQPVKLPVFSYHILTSAFYYAVVWLTGNRVGRIVEVALRRAGLVLRWVTVIGYIVLIINQATQANSAWLSGYPSIGR